MRLSDTIDKMILSFLTGASLTGCGMATEATNNADPIPSELEKTSISPEFETTAHYLANEAIFIKGADTKIMFDPFFVTGFGTYTELPAEIKAMIMKGTSPFDGMKAVFVSHAHGDHFSAPDMITYMTLHETVHLIAPQQAVDMMREDPTWAEGLASRITPLSLEYGDAPVDLKIGSLKASAVRIAHAGWPAPNRARVENILFRVQISDGVTVMHMGDADPNPVHYEPYETHWKALRTNTAFPPYWMLTSSNGLEIMEDLNVQNRIGIHVPITIPFELRASGEDYFSNIGEMRQVGQ